MKSYDKQLHISIIKCHLTKYGAFRSLFWKKIYTLFGSAPKSALRSQRVKETFWSSMPEILPCDYCMKKWEMYLKNTMFQYINYWCSLRKETLVNSCCRVCVRCLNYGKGSCWGSTSPSDHSPVCVQCASVFCSCRAFSAVMQIFTCP